jgi:hypothetical protein
MFNALFTECANINCWMIYCIFCAECRLNRPFWRSFNLHQWSVETRFTPLSLVQNLILVRVYIEACVKHVTRYFSCSKSKTWSLNKGLLLYIICTISNVMLNVMNALQWIKNVLLACFSSLVDVYLSYLINQNVFNIARRHISF